jgi:hypothetical protein
MGVARALVTGSGCAPEWICLVSNCQSAMMLSLSWW